MFFRNILFYKRLLLSVFLLLIMGTAWLGQPAISEYFTMEQQLTMALLAFAIYLWIAAPIPSGASSLLLLGLMLLLNLAGSMEEALAGFLSPALYFILVLALISQSLVKAGVDQAVSRFLIKFSKNSPRFIIIGLPVVILILPILLPSAVARFKMLFPLVNNLNNLYGYPNRSIFQKYSIYVIGMLNQNATMVIFTGGGFPILASQLISDYNVADLEWLEWFLMIAPPLWLASGLMVLFVWGFLRYTLPKEKIIRGNRTDTSADEKNEEPLTIKFWVVLLSFLIMVVTWIITDQGQVPLLLPPLLLIAFYSLPRLGLVTNEMIRSYDWETFLLLGASFSLGMLLDDNGTAEELANVLLNMIPEHAGMVVNIIIITLIVAVLRFFFIVPSAAMIVIFPIVISYSELMGIAPVQLSFLVVLVIGSMMILPIHTATTYLAFETGILSKREQYVMGFVSTVIYITIAVLAAIYFW